MKVDATVGGYMGNAAAAITLVVSLIDALQKSGKLSKDDVQQILRDAESWLTDGLTTTNEARKVFQSIR